MSRYFPPPERYHPLLTLSLRAQPEGGRLLAAVSANPALILRRELVVLVHGFANHQGEAAKAYLGFRDRQDSSDARIAALLAVLADSFWPGDAAWGVADFADVLVYPSAVGTAKDAAPRLARFLSSVPGLLKVHFVAHSLGCRLALETVSLLGRRGAPQIGRVCLMAAAIPVFMVEPGGRLAAALPYCESVHSFYSLKDGVLNYAFRAGQTAAGGGEGFFPRALGAQHPPPTPGVVYATHLLGAGHSDYWGQSDRAPAKVMPRLASAYLAITPQLREAGVSRAPGAGSASVQTREVASARVAGRGRAL